MDVDMSRTLDTLRQQNQALLDQLRARQSTVKGLLGTFSTGRYSTETTERDSQPRNPQDEVHITTSKPMDFTSTDTGAYAPTKIHLYKKDLHGLGSSGVTGNVSFESEDFVTDSSMCSTPMKNQTPKDGTTQSILKRRKIIDDNIRVESQYPQTPTRSGGLQNSRNLNFSYSDVDDMDMDMLKKVIRNQLEIDMALEDSLAGRSQNARNMEKEAEQLAKQRLLQDSGNDRQHSAIIRELSTRPKSVIFDDNAPQGREKFDSSVCPRRTPALTSQRDGERPLLGYDFIAGLLDNESMLVDKSDAFYDELNEFRRVNKEDCTGKTTIESVLDLTRPISPELRSPGHTCIHGFNVNERLYPEPLNEDDVGRSVCPVCLTTRQDPTQEEPAYVRVSIPRSTLLAPYRVKPHRRRSFDDTDNFALSKHCLAGWECSQPSMLPTASTVDLKQAADGLKAKLTNTLQDIEAITASYKRLPKEESLLDTSRALRANAQFYAMNRSVNPLHSTAY